MANIVDQFLLMFSIDASGVQQGAKQTKEQLKELKAAQDQYAKDVEEDGKKAAYFFTNIRNEALTLIGVLAGTTGLGAIIKNTAHDVVQLANAAQFTGVSAQDMMAMGVAMTFNGDAAEDATASFQQLKKQMTDLTTLGQGSNEFKQMMGYLTKFGGDVRTSTPLQMMEAANKWSNSADAAAIPLARRQALLLSMLGNQAMVREAMKSEAEFNADQAKGHTYVPTDEEVKRTKELTAAFAEFGASVHKVMIDFTANVSPWLTPLLQDLSSWMNTHPDAAVDIIKVASALGVMLGALTALKLAFAALAPFRWLFAILFGGAEAGAATAGTATALEATAVAGEVAAVGTTIGGAIAAGFVAALTSTAWLAPLFAALGMVGPTQGDPEDQKRRADYAKDHPDYLNPDSGPSIWGWVKGKLGFGGGDKPTGIGSLPTDSVSKGKAIAANLQKDLGLTADQAAAIVGNLEHETGGFKHLQEINPTGGGRGGLGWAQWTGPRRREFEAWSKEHNLDPMSDEANYGFLLHDLKGKYSGTLESLKNTHGVAEGTGVFEKGYEGAGVVAMMSRLNWASKLLSGAPVSNRLPSSGAPSSGAAHGQMASVNIGDVTVHTQATDAHGIVKDIHKEFARQADHLVFQGQTGLA